MSGPAVDTTPWVPEGGWPHIFVGARVRVRLSGECRVAWSREASALGAVLSKDPGGDWTVGHGYDPGGHVGVITLIDTRLTHGFQISFDQVCREEDREWIGGWYAANELEPA